MSYFYAERLNNCISLFFNSQQPLPPLPYELQGVISFATWESRTRAVRDLCVRHTKPALERAWFFFSFLVTITLPMVIYRVLVDKKLKQFDNLTFDQLTTDQRHQIDDAILQSRAISIGVLAGVFLLFWVPFGIWKSLGRRRARNLTQAWNAEDLAANPGGFAPTWQIKVPGVFTINGSLVVTVPPRMQPSVFHPDAYLPAYLQRAPFHSYAPRTDGPQVVAYNGNGYVDEKNAADFMDVNLNNNNNNGGNNVGYERNNTQVYKGPFSDAHRVV